jgi:hypothetical protein
VVINVCATTKPYPHAFSPPPPVLPSFFLPHETNSDPYADVAGLYTN